MGKKREVPDKDEFTELWTSGKWTQRRMAQFYGVSGRTVANWARGFKLGKKTKSRPPVWHTADPKNRDTCLDCKYPDCVPECVVHRT